MSQDIVADCLNEIMNAKRAKKQEIEIKRHSKFLISILNLMKNLGYLEYRSEDNLLKIEVKDLSECKAIKPRFYVAVDEIDKYVRRFLPARNFGCIIISTNQGLMTHDEAQEKNLGGSLIAYVF